MKLDPSTITTAREWFAKRWTMLAIGAACLFGLLVLASNIRARIGRDAQAPAAPVATARALAAPAPTRVAEVAPTQAAAPIPHIAQQRTAAAIAPAAIAASSAAPLPVAAPIQPPAGIQAGFMLQKNYQQAQFGLTQTSVDVVGVQTLSVQAPATDGDGERATEWNAWFNLTKPTTIAWVRTAGGEGTIAVTIDGTRLGDPVDHWPMSGPLSNLATVPLTAGWHQVTVHDTRRGWVRGPGVAVRIDLGDGSGATVSPQPWAVPPTTGTPAPASSAIPHIAQQSEPAIASTAASRASQPTISSNAVATMPAAATTTGGAK